MRVRLLSEVRKLRVATILNGVFLNCTRIISLLMQTYCIHKWTAAAPHIRPRTAQLMDNFSQYVLHYVREVFTYKRT